MTIYADVTVTRPASNGPVNAEPIPVQIDETSETMGAYYNSAHPYDVFHIIVRYTTFVFQRNDLLTDTVNTDYLTGVLAMYRVVGNPRRYPDGHAELYVNRFAGPQS